MTYDQEIMLVPSTFSEEEWYSKLIDITTNRLMDTDFQSLKVLVSAATTGDVATIKKLLRSGVANEYLERHNCFQIVGEETRIKEKLAALEALLESKIAIIPPQQFLENKRHVRMLFNVTIVNGSPIKTYLLINKRVVQGWDSSSAIKGRSPVHIFCLIPDVHPKVVKYVLKIIPDGVNVKTKMNFTPLMLAVVKCNFALVKFLVENGADVNHSVTLIEYIDDEDKYRFSFMKVFVVEEIVVPSRLECKYNALAAAVLSRHRSIILYLLYNGADPNSNEDIDWVLLFHSVKNDAIRVVDILLQQGLKVNCRDSMGVTALHRTVEIGTTEMANVLLKYGGDVNATDILGWTPLHVACLFSKKRMVKLLLDAGSNVNAITNTGFTALTIAEAGHNKNFLSHLCHSINSHLLSDLYLVNQYSSIGHANLINLLLDRGAKIDDQDSILGWSALHWAVASGDWRVAVLLVSRGANTKIKSKMGHNPYETAIFFRRDFIKDFLSNCNALG